MKTTKETPNTPTKRKGDSSPFRKFEQLAKKIVRVPRERTQDGRKHE